MDLLTNDPRPVKFGDEICVLWIQNQGQAMVGDAIQGDSLMQRTWDGSDWAASETLWSGQKGIAEVIVLVSCF